MRFIVFLGLVALVCGRDLRGDSPPRWFRLGPKDKRGLGDHPSTFPSHGPISYAAPVHSGLSSGYSLGGSSAGFPLALHGLGGSVGPGIGYPLAPSPHLASGYLSQGGQSHGPLGLQGLSSLGGHAAQSTYPVPSVTSLAGGSNGFFVPSKNGPVTFGLHGGSGAASPSASSTHSAPIYAAGSHGLSQYNSGGSSISLPVLLTSHGLSLGSSGGPSGTSYSLQSASSGSSYPVTGGLVIASGSHGSSSYRLPVSGSTHGISALSGSPGSHAASQGASSTYSLPITSGSHGISASSGSAASSYAASASSGSYGASGGHASSDSYDAPASSGSSYSSSGSSGSGSYASYLSPQSDSSSSYSSGASYNPTVTYATPSSNYVDASSSDDAYTGAASGYSALSSGHSNPSSSYSSPLISYAGTSTYTPMYATSSGSYGGSSAESRGSYSSANPRYIRYVVPKAYDSEDSESVKYDTISYSSPDGKYSVA